MTNIELKDFNEMSKTIEEHVLDKLTSNIMQWDEVHRNSNSVLQEEIKLENQKFLFKIKEEFHHLENKMDHMMSELTLKVSDKVHDLNVKVVSNEKAMWPKRSYYIMWLIVVFTMGLNFVLIFFGNLNNTLGKNTFLRIDILLYIFGGILLMLSVNCFLTIRRKQEIKNENVILSEILEEVRKNSEFRIETKTEILEEVRKNSEFRKETEKIIGEI